MLTYILNMVWLPCNSNTYNNFGNLSVVSERRATQNKSANKGKSNIIEQELFLLKIAIINLIYLMQNNKDKLST